MFKKQKHNNLCLCLFQHFNFWKILETIVADDSGCVSLATGDCPLAQPFLAAIALIEPKMANCGFFAL